MEMEDAQRNELLQMDSRQMYVSDRSSCANVLIVPHRRDVAAFVNSYPTLDVTHEFVKGEYTSSTPIVLQISLSRDADEEDDGDISVVAPCFPGKKTANWWVVVGEQSTRQLLSIKRVTVPKSLGVKLEFTLPKGTHLLKLYVICDSYVGVDHDINLEPLEVAEGEDSDSDEDSDGSDGSDEMEVEKLG
jgi:pre-mRNA-splicing helicase BRR2